jgi:hypothetical protein
MIRGGLRTRLVVDSVRFAIISTMDQLGWFDPTVYDTPPGVRRHRSFRYIRRPVDWGENIEPNAIAISSQDIGDNDLAFGGDVQDRHEIYADVFAQDDSVGWQVSYDIRDSLLGKNPELGTLGPQIDVYDFRQATPAPFTTVDVDLIRVDHSQGETREWQQHWFMLRILVEDDYNDEADIIPTRRGTWAAAEATNWGRIQEAEVHVP